MRIDAGAAAAIGAAATLSTADITPGNHTVQLGGVAANCTVSGDNPRTVSVTAGEKATVAFAVTCNATSPTTGIIRVSVATSGSPTDPDGYVAKLDGTDPGLVTGTNGSVSFTGVAVGSHTVALTGVAANCSVTDGASRSTTVAAGATAEISFAVTCAGTTGSIKVTTVTTGSALDDGYTVSVDGGASQPIGINASLTIPDVAAGGHSVALAGLASNCTAADANPRTVTVTAGAQAAVGFTVTCTSTGATQWTTIPLPSDFVASALWASSGSDIFIVGRYKSDPSTASQLVLHYDGHEWAEQLRGRDWLNSPNAVWGTSPTDVFAAGASGVWHYDGTRWLIIDTGQPVPNYLDIWGTSAQDLFAVGGDDDSQRGRGLIVHYDGATWAYMGTGGLGDQGYVYDVSGNSPTDVYAVGYQPAASDTPPEFYYTDYRVVHYDGSAWSLSFQIRNGPPEPANSISLSGVWPVAQNNVFVVGSGGHIFHFDGAAWSPMTSPTTQNLEDVWGNAGSNVYAVGDAGILRYDGASWTVNNPTPGSRVWGAGADVFVLRKDGGAILHGTP